MNKEWFNTEHQDDELPRDEIMKAIENGINEGSKIKRKNKVRSGMKLSAWVTGTAASVVLASGFVFSPVNTVLAEVPVLGKLYDQLNFETGKELAASNLVTEINQKATSNGVDVTVTSAFYDGNVIGVTIKAEGEDLSLAAMDKERSPEAGYTLGGNDKDQLAGARGGLKEVKKGSYVAALEFEMREVELPKNYTLPLNFTQMANKKGSWRFNIPVAQLPGETVKLDAKGTSQDGVHTIEMNSLSIGKATATFNYTSKHPVDGIEENVNLKVIDDKGRRVSIRSEGVLKLTENQSSIEKDRELQLGKIEEDTEYLVVHPEVVKNELDVTEPLNQALPFEISNLHSDFKVIIKRVLKQSNMLVVDYEIMNVNQTKVNDDGYKQFADFIGLIRTSEVIKSDDMQSQYNALDSPDDLIFSNKSKRLDKNKLHFQTTFNLNRVNNFSINEYSLMIPFRELNKDERIKLAPIKIKIK